METSTASMAAHVYNPAAERQEDYVFKIPSAHSKFKATLCYMRPCLTKTKHMDWRDSSVDKMLAAKA